MNRDYEKLQKPIDWLAARGMTCRSFEEQFPEPEKWNDHEPDNFPMSRMRGLGEAIQKGSWNKTVGSL